MTTTRVTWTETRRRLAEDDARIRTMLRERFGAEPRSLFFDASWRCVVLYRVAHYFWQREARLTSRVFFQLNSLVTGADIAPTCEIGGGFLIPHPTGIAVSCHAGRNLTMMSRSGLGTAPPRAKDIGAGPGLPHLGDDVWLGAGCGVIGAVRVGSRSRLQPGAVLAHNVPPDSFVEMIGRPVARGVTRAGAAPFHATPTACDHDRLRSAWRDLNSDIMRHLKTRLGAGVGEPGALRKLSAVLSTGVIGVAIYRLSHFLYCAGRPGLARFACNANILLLRLTISPASCLGGGLLVPHPAGVVVNARAGRDLTMYGHSIAASLGPALATPVQEGPAIGDRALIAGMAAALGPISVGDRTRIGFNVHLFVNAPAEQLVSGREMITRVSPLGVSSDVAAADRGPLVVRVSYAKTRELIRRDRERVDEMYAGKAPWASRTCIFLFRHARYFLGNERLGLAIACWRVNIRLTGADIDPRSDIGEGLAIPNPAGISLHATAGRNLTVLALASIGPQHARQPFSNDVGARPVLGDDVVVSEHAAVHGQIFVGARTRIGPGCKIVWDVPENADLVMPAARMRRTPNAGVKSS